MEKAKPERGGNGASRHPENLSDARPGTVWLTVLWCALSIAVLDDGVILFHRHVLDEITRASPHAYWMSGLANLIVLAPIAGVLWGYSAIRRRAVPLSLYISVLATVGFAALLYEIRGLHPIGVGALGLGLGAVLYRSLVRLSDLSRLVQRTTPVLAVALLLTAVTTFTSASVRDARLMRALPAIETDAPNVLLLVLDTVRESSTSLSGSGGGLTPALEQIASTGVTFDRAYSTSPWTLPSHASMFTGRYPHELRTGFYSPLDVTYPTLAEVLSRQGYETAGFVGNTHYVTRDFGLARGFVHFEDYRVSIGQILLSSALGRRLTSANPLRSMLRWHQLVDRIDGRQIQGSFFRWLDRRGSDRPYFAFLNYYDAHEPYLPEPPYDELFGSESIDRPLWHFSNLRDGTEARRSNEWLENPGPFDRDLRAYQGAVAALDARIGEFVAELERRGDLENTILVITSDHGELLGEHELFYHWNNVYEPTLHVPLVIRRPGELDAGHRVSRPVSLIDLPATLLEMTGVLGADQIPGQSFMSPESRPSPGDGEPADNRPSRVVLSELEGGPLFSGFYENYHYIVWPSAGAEELYDLENDPDELVNLAQDPEMIESVRLMRDLVATEIQTPRR